MNPTPPPPSQNSHAVRWHCAAEAERRVAEIKIIFIILLFYYYYQFIIIIFKPTSTKPQAEKLG